MFIIVQNPAYMPHKSKALKYKPKKAFYTPQQDFFEGYYQFRCPRTAPYYNVRRQIKHDKKKKRMIKCMKEDLKPEIWKNPKNKRIWNYEGIRAKTVGVKHITGKINKMSTHDKDLQNERFRTLRRKTNYVYREKVKKDPTKKKAVWSFTERAIHGRTLKKPNIQLFTRKMDKWKELKKKAMTKIKKTEGKIEAMRKMGLTQIKDFNKTRYKSIATTRERKTNFLTTTNASTQLKFKIHEQLQKQERRNKSALTDRVLRYRTNTFNIPPTLRLDLKDMFNSGKKLLLEKDYLTRAHSEVRRIKDTAVFQLLI